MKKLYSYEVKNKAARFLACKKLVDLRRLGFDINALQLKAINPPYYNFEVPKKSGGVRKIEAPEEGLKQIQHQLNTYLQCIYYTQQSTAAYGYIISVRDGVNQKNILGNARKHHGAKYLLNADFQDFFHQIKTNQIFGILQSYPFQFNKRSAHLLSKLMTKNGRLPMGAPTSPVLSNLATLELDAALTKWAISQKLSYTRFVDDLTFSSKNSQIKLSDFAVIQKVAGEFGFQFNTTKTKFFDDHHTKKVTGLLLNATIDIDPQFYRALDRNLKRLKTLVEVKQLINSYRPSNLFREFKQRVDGQINFIGMIEGYDSPEFRKYRKRLQGVLQPSEEVLSARWVNMNYF